MFYCLLFFNMGITMIRTDNKKMTTRNTAGVALESRVGKLEGTMEKLAQEVRITNQNMQRISDNFISFKEDLLSKIGTITTPKWPMIFSAVTLLVTILGLGGTIIALMISGQKEILREHDIQLIEIQRSINSDKVEQTKANTHIEELVSSLEKEHKATEDLVTDLKTWRLNHAQQNGSNTAKLDMLEKAIDRLEARQLEGLKAVSQLDYFRPSAGNVTLRLKDEQNNANTKGSKTSN